MGRDRPLRRAVAPCVPSAALRAVRVALSTFRFGSSTVRRPVGRAKREIVRVAVGLIARVYFDISYGLLTESVAGRRLLSLQAAGGGLVHGYFTSQDRDLLLADLDPAPGDRLLDLGCGVGGIALDLHRRSGAQILGLDLSPKAVFAATAQARRAGLDASVGFVVGDLSRPPRVGAANAYAIDSLMFVHDLGQTLRGIGDALGSDGRLFATLLVFGTGAEARLRRSICAAGAGILRLEDATPALVERSRARTAAAVAMLRDETTSLRGRLAMRLVIAEEGLVRALITAGRVGRWRFVLRYCPTTEREAAHSRPAATVASCVQTR